MAVLLDSLAQGFKGDASQRAALDEALRDGLPGARSEAWKYTSLRALEPVSYTHLDVYKRHVQNWYPGDENGKGGIYNFVTKRAECRGARSKVTWTQVETGSAITLSLIHI